MTVQGSPFEVIKQTRVDGSEYWSARELQPLLGYVDWDKFEDVLDRAKIACANAGQEPVDHMVGADHMIEIGKGAKRKVRDYHLTRYACYLVAMNGDPRKPEISAAQTYFAVKTREREIEEQRRPLSLTQQLLLQAQAMVEQERRQLQLEAEQRHLASRIDTIEAEKRAAETSLTYVAIPAEEAKELTTRAKLNMVVREFCNQTACNYRWAWENLYRQFKYRYKVDLPTRARNADAKALDYAEEHGFIEELYALTCTLYANKAN